MIDVAGFHIYETLHDSSQTVVYRGWQESQQRPAVAKVLKPQFAITQSRRRFEHDYHLRSSLTCPGFIIYYGLQPVGHSLADLPPLLEGIVSKLMAKHADDRYHSAAGLLYDLTKAQQQWHETGRITPFTLDQYDANRYLRWPDTFHVTGSPVTAPDSMKCAISADS